AIQAPRKPATDEAAARKAARRVPFRDDERVDGALVRRATAAGRRVITTPGPPARRARDRVAARRRPGGRSPRTLRRHAAARGRVPGAAAASARSGPAE